MEPKRFSGKFQVPTFVLTSVLVVVVAMLLSSLSFWLSLSSLSLSSLSLSSLSFLLLLLLLLLLCVRRTENYHKNCYPSYSTMGAKMT